MTTTPNATTAPMVETEATAGPRTYYAALDLGQSQDYSALAVLERQVPADVDGEPSLPHFALRLLHRWQLKTPYPQVVEDVAAWMNKPPLTGCILGIDGTGVGAPVVDMFRQAKLPVRLTPVLITGGHEVTRDERGCWHVPKKELVGALQVLLQSRRLKFAAVPERDILVRELQHFKVKVSVAGNESFEAWRERDHDDLVLATAIAAFLASKMVVGTGVMEGSGDSYDGGPMARVPENMFWTDGNGGSRADHMDYDPDGRPW